jgi:predicted acylesterase/phospholipase RssA
MFDICPWWLFPVNEGGPHKMGQESPDNLNFETIFAAERQLIQQKRQNHHPEDQKGPSFGIALSGGGIRSATLNLGVLEVLNACDILKRADYLSSVSGGGYIAGYVHAHVKKDGPCAYRQMFSQEAINSLRNSGYYLAPGRGLKQIWSRLRMSGTLVASLLMNWIWVMALAGVLIFGSKVISYHLNLLPLYQGLIAPVLIGAAIILAWHYFLHGLRNIHLWNSDVLNTLEGIFLLLVVLLGGLHLAGGAQPGNGTGLQISLAVLLVTGFFANPNLLTLHRFYRDRLREAFLRITGTGDTGLKIAEIGPGAGGWAPYPLINTCLNLFSWRDRKFKGTMSNDYFLLSPRYCGSKLTGYIETKNPVYKNMTLATAVAVSGAAVNPHMGTRSNRIAAFFLTLLNLRLGYWALSPNPKIPWLFRYITWWPYYHILELLSLKGISRWRVNLSDGGHIENLGIYELLRRGCRLIIAVDATADPHYAFADLKNLVTRARNELGLAITFRQEPETFIRPLPSQGFSQSHYVIADISDLLGKEEGKQLYKDEEPGLLIYLKASMRAPGRWRRKRIESDSYDYKTYHPAFPHESTADQFFDPDQWGAYYRLGRFMAGDLLGVEVTEDKIDGGKCKISSIQELFEKFNKIVDSAALEKLLTNWDKKMQRTETQENDPR